MKLSKKTLSLFLSVCILAQGSILGFNNISLAAGNSNVKTYYNKKSTKKLHKKANKSKIKKKVSQKNNIRKPNDYKKLMVNNFYNAKEKSGDKLYNINNVVKVRLNRNLEKNNFSIFRNYSNNRIEYTVRYNPIFREIRNGNNRDYYGTFSSIVVKDIDNTNLRRLSTKQIWSKVMSGDFDLCFPNNFVILVEKPNHKRYLVTLPQSGDCSLTQRDINRVSKYLVNSSKQITHIEPADKNSTMAVATMYDFKLRY